MYIIHLVLTHLMGLVTFMPVNQQIVSERINGCFAEVVSCPLLGGLPVTCHMCLQGAASTCRWLVFFIVIFIPKHYLLKKSIFFLGLKDVSCFQQHAFVSKEVFYFIMLPWKCSLPNQNQEIFKFVKKKKIV